MGRRFVVGTFVGVVLCAGLAGCAAAGGSASESPAASPAGSPFPSPPDVTPTPDATLALGPLEVFCDENLELHVSSTTVTATSAGVPMLVSSEAPAGSYLVRDFGGDELPASPELWTYTPAPGVFTLRCWDPGSDAAGAKVDISLVDTEGYWSPTTVADYGCSGAGSTDWAYGPGAGGTADAAIEDLVANFDAGGTRHTLSRWELAGVGYADAPTQTWLAGSDDSPAFSVLVDASTTGAGFTAMADAVCQGGTWPVER